MHVLSSTLYFNALLFKLKVWRHLLRLLESPHLFSNLLICNINPVTIVLLKSLITFVSSSGLVAVCSTACFRSSIVSSNMFLSSWSFSTSSLSVVPLTNSSSFEMRKRRRGGTEMWEGRRANDWQGEERVKVWEGGKQREKGMEVEGKNLAYSHTRCYWS